MAAVVDLRKTITRCITKSANSVMRCKVSTSRSLVASIVSCVLVMCRLTLVFCIVHMVYRKQSVKLGNWLDLLTRVNDVNGKQEQEKNVTGHDINLESKCFNVNKNRGIAPAAKNRHLLEFQRDTLFFSELSGSY